MSEESEFRDITAEIDEMLAEHKKGEIERIARAFHETYEKLAPEFSYSTRKASAVPWPQVPENNRSLMIAVVIELLKQGVIEVGESP